MAIRSLDELLEDVRAALGDAVGNDNSLALIENVTDTLTSLQPAEGAVDWEARYQENDAAWRQRYADRFFGGSDPDVVEQNDDTNADDSVKMTFEELFKED